MSIHSRMVRTFEVWARDTEASTWLLAHAAIPGSLELMTPSGQRNETATDALPEVTHTIRAPLSAESILLGGRRLRDQSDGREYSVIVCRARPKPRPGHCRVSVAYVPATTQD